MQMPGRKYPVPEPIPLAGAGSPSSPIELYRHGFKSKASGTSTTYAIAPNTLSAYLDSSQWTLSTPGYSGVFVTYPSPVSSGPSQDSALGFAVTPTGGASMTLTFQVKPGYRATISSFSFYNRSTAVNPLTDTTTGYRHWYMTINGTTVGGDTLNRYSVPLLSTGTRALDNPLSALTGTVTVTLHYYRAHDQTGTLRIDNFVLNGFVQQIPNSGNAPVTSADGKGYRYGFNGQERDGEVGEDSYGALYWEYDSRIARRWNQDPKPRIGYSRYQCFSNNPLFYADPLGDTTINGQKYEPKHKKDATVLETIIVRGQSKRSQQSPYIKAIERAPDLKKVMITQVPWGDIIQMGEKDLQRLYINSINSHPKSIQRQMLPQMQRNFSKFMGGVQIFGAVSAYTDWALANMKGIKAPLPDPLPFSPSATIVGDITAIQMEELVNSSISQAMKGNISLRELAQGLEAAALRGYYTGLKGTYVSLGELSAIEVNGGRVDATLLRFPRYSFDESYPTREGVPYNCFILYRSDVVIPITIQPVR